MWLVSIEIFFFKQKTAYEMRISDWSSDVCSSDLPKHNNGRWNIADPRDVPMDAEFAALPDPKDRLVCRIIATDNTWHRPFTTLDLASLQALFDPEEAFGCENGEIGRAHV